MGIISEVIFKSNLAMKSIVKGNNILYHACGNRIQACSWLIQKQQLRVIEQGSREIEPHLHALGVIGNPLLRAVGEVHQLQQFHG